MLISPRVFFAVIVTVLSAGPVLAQAPTPPATVKIEGHFEKLNEQKALTYVLVQGQEQFFVVQDVDKDTLIEKLKGFKKGDLLVLDVVKEPDKPSILKGVSVKTVQVGRWLRFGILLLSVGALWAVVFGLLRVAGKNFSDTLVGEDNRYSNSKIQLVVWFGVVLGSYIATVFLRWWACENCFIAGVDIPTELVELSGLSAASFGGAKAITTWKDNAAKKAKQPGKSQASEGERQFLSNLLTNDKKQADLGDIQMLIITLMAVVVYLATAFKFLGTIQCVKTITLPGVDTTILSFFGLGQGAYLLKKAGGRPGES